MAERLTDRGITALKATDTSVLYFDSEVSGLAVRVYPTGRRVFVFDWRENGKQRRKTIGAFPSWTIGKARPTPVVSPRRFGEAVALDGREGCRPGRAVVRRRQAHTQARHRSRLLPHDGQPHLASLRQT
jgi:hypothetical protein